MAFFGLTQLGGGNTSMIFQQLQAKKLDIHHVTDERFSAAFSKFCIASAPLVVEPIDADPATVMRRVDLAKVLCEVLERDPTNDEIDAFSTFFNTETNGLISLQEYWKSIESLRKRSAAPSSATNYVSKKQMEDDRTKHRRLENNPQNVQVKPATTAQEVGWDAQKPISQATTGYTILHPAMGQTFHGKKTSDVTSGEGRSITDWYI